MKLIDFAYILCVCSLGDQNAINDLMQMRLSAGGGGGMMAEKLEVGVLSLQLCSCFRDYDSPDLLI